MENKTCKLYDQVKELKNSHVIGKSVFRELLKRSNTHYGLVTEPENKRIIRSTDQWASMMLCNDCENLLNSRYENYALWVLKNKQKGVKHKIRLQYFTIAPVNQYRLIMYVISIIWRAAVSQHKVFRQVEFSTEITEYLKQCILGKVTLDHNLFSVKISKLIDSRNYYTEDVIQGVITNLAPRSNGKNVSYLMVFLGYCFEIKLACEEINELYEIGVLRKKKSILHIPYVDMLSIPEVFRSLKVTKEIAEKYPQKLNFLS